MKVAAVFAFALSLGCCSVLGQPPPFSEKCETDAYPPKPQEKVATYIVNLDLPPAERWTKLIVDKKQDIRNLMEHIKNLTEPFFHGYLIKFLDKVLPLLAKTLPYPYPEELTSISNLTGIPLGEITLYNIFYEVFSVCTSIVAEDTHGKIYHARNLDFGLLMGWNPKNHTWDVAELLKPLIANVEFQKGGKTVFKSVQYAGAIGVFTGMKPQLFSISVDERFTVKGGYLGIFQWILGYRNASWVGFLAREVLENSTSFIEAQKIFAKTELLSPVYFILGGNSSGQGCVITRGKTDFDIWMMGTQNSTWFLVETNYDHWKNPLWIDDRRTPAIHCMNELTQKNLSLPGLYNVLSTKPVRNKLTTLTALMQVDAGYLETYLRDCPDPCFPF